MTFSSFLLFVTKNPQLVYLKKIILFTFLDLFTLAVLGLRCCVGFPLVAASRGCCPVALCGLLMAVTSPAVELRL